MSIKYLDSEITILIVHVDDIVKAHENQEEITGLKKHLCT